MHVDGRVRYVQHAHGILYGICVHTCEMHQLLSSTFSTARSGCEGGSVTTGVSAMALPSSGGISFEHANSCKMT